MFFYRFIHVNKVLKSSYKLKLNADFFTPSTSINIRRQLYTLAKKLLVNIVFCFFCH